MMSNSRLWRIRRHMAPYRITQVHDPDTLYPFGVAGKHIQPMHNVLQPADAGEDDVWIDVHPGTQLDGCRWNLSPVEQRSTDGPVQAPGNLVVRDKLVDHG